MVKCLDGAQRGDSEHILLSGIPRGLLAYS